MFLSSVDFIGDKRSSGFLQDVLLDQTTLGYFDFHSCWKMIDMIDEMIIEKRKKSFHWMSRLGSISVDLQQSIQEKVLHEGILTGMNMIDALFEALH